MQSRQKRLCARGCSARRCSALTRRNDIPLHRIMNCGLARRLCPPDVVPARAWVRAGLFCAALLCADAKKRYSASRGVNCGLAWRLCPPDIVPAEAFVRAGGWSAGQSKSIAAICVRPCLLYVSVGMFCVRFMPDMRFYCGVLCSVHTRHTFLLGGPAFGSRLSLFLCQEKRDGLRYVSFLFRRGS